MHFIKPLPVGILLCLLMSLGCNYQNDKRDIKQHSEQPHSMESGKPEEFGYTVDTSEQSSEANGERQYAPPAKTDWDKKIIKTASLNMEVKDYKKFSSNIRDITRRAGGYIAREDQRQSEYKLENVIVIKVPVDRFEEAMNLLADSGEKVLERKISSEDVTGEVVDTRSRMQAKKQVRQRYLDLLKQAKNMSEIMQVQNEINDIQEEIESATGRVNYLIHAAALSTIELTYFQVIKQGAGKKDNPSFGSRMVQSMFDGAKWVGELLLLLMSFWPLVTGLMIAYLFYRRGRFIKNKSV